MTKMQSINAMLKCLGEVFFHRGKDIAHSCLGFIESYTEVDIRSNKDEWDRLLSGYQEFTSVLKKLGVKHEQWASPIKSPFDIETTAKLALVLINYKLSKHVRNISHKEFMLRVLNDYIDTLKKVPTELDWVVSLYQEVTYDV